MQKLFRGKNYEYEENNTTEINIIVTIVLIVYNNLDHPISFNYNQFLTRMTIRGYAKNIFFCSRFIDLSRSDFAEPQID